MSAHGAGHSENVETRHILILLFSAKKCNTTISNNCEHCLEMLKKKIKSYVVRVVFLSHFEICVSPDTLSV